MTGVLRNLDTSTYTERDHYVKIKAELRVRHQKPSDIKDSSKPPELGGRNRKDYPSQPSGGSNSTTKFGFPASRTMGQ